MRLQGKVALVTGAGQGIGRQIALHLAEEGAAVAVNYPASTEQAESVVDEIRSAGGRAIAVQADVSQLDQVGAMVRQTLEQFGRIDILVNNAGIDEGAPFLDVPGELFDRVIDTNLKGVFFCSQFAAREMRKTGCGRIVNIGSVHSQASMPGSSVYAASKAGIDGLTRQLAIELSPFNITINAIAPGAIEVEKFVSDPAYDPVAIGKEIPMGRVGKPRDISSAVVFLASDDAGWLTGKVITIDGGTLSRLYLYAGRPIPTGTLQPADPQEEKEKA